MMVKTLVLLSAIAVVGCASDAKYSEVAFKDAPISVRMGIEKAFPDAKVKAIEKEVYADGTVHYEVELVTKDGVSKEVEFAPDGELLDKH